jgi:hypothetical protein
VELLLWASFLAFAAEVALALLAVPRGRVLGRISFVALGLALFVLAFIVGTYGPVEIG